MAAVPQFIQPSKAESLLTQLHSMPGYQVRVVIEYLQLEERRAALAGYVKGDHYRSLHVNERARLTRQLSAMTDYALVLSERIEAFDTKE